MKDEYLEGEYWMMKDEYLKGEGWCMTSSSSLDYSVYRCDSSGLKSLL